MPTIVPLLTNVIDGDFTFPVEVEGSPLITTDEVTRAMQVTRTFAVLNASYVPLVQGVFDPVFKTVRLVNEQPVGIQGPILFFQRVFSQVPVTRTEGRTVSFTKPGISDTQISSVSAQIIGWNQYGLAAPNTRAVAATVEISYYTTPFPPRPAITQITYAGAPVDFTGTVYAYGGNRTNVISPTQSVVEPFWVLRGATLPLVTPGTWILEVNVSRWRGNIWQMEVVSVNPYAL